jgi:threonine dehydratase
VVSAPATTIADGIAVRVPVPRIMPELYACMNEVLEVSEEHLRSAMKEVFSHHGIVTEPAGVAGVAALLAYPEHFPRDIVATAFCGGNISPELRTELFVERGAEYGCTKDTNAR